MIETERCLLTAPRPADLDTVVRLYTDARVRRHLGGPRSEADARMAFAAMLDGRPDEHTWVIRLRAGGEPVGLVILAPHHNRSDTEVSYLLLPDVWGQGYAGEAVRAVIDHALNGLGLTRVVAETQAANAASRRMLERVGLRASQTLTRFGAAQVIYTTDDASRPCR